MKDVTLQLALSLRPMALFLLSAKFSKGESEIVVDAVKRYAKENDISVEVRCCICHIP